MSEIRYNARVLDSRNLSVPAGVELPVGEEIEVILKPVKGRRKVKHWMDRMTPEDRKAFEDNQRKLDELMTRVTGPKDLSRNWAHYLAKNRFK